MAEGDVKSAKMAEGDVISGAAAAVVKHQVLIAIDGGEESENAFNFYMDNLHLPGNELLVVHGAELPPLSTNEAAAMCQQMYDTLLEAEKKRVKELEERYAQKMRTHNMTGKITAVFCGRPGELIVDIADKESVQMIVIGSRGFGLLRRTIMGSVSDYVVHHAHCPVVVCRAPAHAKKPRTTSASSS
jgi:nucleotide-binding universal stress UspA family protein